MIEAAAERLKYRTYLRKTAFYHTVLSSLAVSGTRRVQYTVACVGIPFECTVPLIYP